MFKTIAAMFVFMMSSISYAYDMQDMLDNHIIPTYQTLAEKNNQLNAVANDYCENQSESELNNLKTINRESFLAWQAAQHIRFGPVLAFSRDRRFEFWPDKRGTVRKQLYELKNDSALQSKDFDITSKSVAVQGFSALEQLIYSNSTIDQTHCLLITTITNNLRTMANEVATEWTTGSNPFVDLFLHPGEDNYIYRGKSELAGELINTMYTQLEIIATRKLELPLGSGLEKARGKRAEGWRSNSALAAISKNLQACHEFYQYSFAPQLKSNQLHQKIELSFKQTQATLKEITMPLSRAVGDAKQRLIVERLQQELSHLKNLVASDLADTLGISLGFNSLDGD